MQSAQELQAAEPLELQAAGPLEPELLLQQDGLRACQWQYPAARIGSAYGTCARGNERRRL